MTILKEVILVNESDEAIGTMEKMEAHVKALLHRAFSVFIFNRKGEMLLQQRSDNKYHSGGLWTNACCSHPAPGEDTAEAASKRLQEELGFITPLKRAFTFTYRADFENGLTENEFDHVFTGVYDGEIFPDKDEVKDYTYKPVEEIEESINLQPWKYTPWFLIAFPELKKRVEASGAVVE
jgi:isopentenyl-diphosphate delta-isomerase